VRRDSCSHPHAKLRTLDGAVRQAYALMKECPGKYYMPNQYENEANVLAHFETTGPEVYRQSDGQVDYFVAGMGTSGTLMGAEGT